MEFTYYVIKAMCFCIILPKGLVTQRRHVIMGLYLEQISDHYYCDFAQFESSLF